jgi:hypothetical protein
MESHATNSTQQSELSLTIRPATIARGLTCLVILIAAIGATANYVIYNVAPDPEHSLARVMRRLDLGHEPSIPALYSSLAMMASAALLAVIAIAAWRSGANYRRHWIGLSILFVLLAIDESVMIHEMVDTVMHQAFGLGGALFFAWVIPGMMFVAIIGVIYLKFLRHLDSLTRWRFIGAAALFVFGAVGMEMVAGMIADSSLGLQSLAHTISQTIEETCEMLGIVLFIYALLDYINMNISTIRIGFSAPCAVTEVASKRTPGDDPVLSGEQD